jgi:hypothetical protein
MGPSPSTSRRMAGRANRDGCMLHSRKRHCSREAIWSSGALGLWGSGGYLGQCHIEGHSLTLTLILKHENCAMGKDLCLNLFLLSSPEVRWKRCLHLDMNYLASDVFTMASCVALELQYRTNRTAFMARMVETL